MLQWTRVDEACVAQQKLNRVGRGDEPAHEPMVGTGQRRAVDRQTTRRRKRGCPARGSLGRRTSDGDRERIWFNANCDVLALADRNAVEVDVEGRLEGCLKRLDSA